MALSGFDAAANPQSGGKLDGRSNKETLVIHEGLLLLVLFVFFEACNANGGNVIDHEIVAQCVALGAPLVRFETDAAAIAKEVGADGRGIDNTTGATETKEG